MNIPPLGAADTADFDGRTILSSGDGGGHLAPSRQPSLEQQMMRLKDLQHAVFSKQRNNDAINATGPPPSSGGGGGNFSSPLIGPGAASPLDSRAPTQRQDGSSGSDPTSSQFDVYRDPTPPTATAAAVCFPMPPTLPNPPPLPEDFSDDFFCGLEVPSLEDLVQNIGKAESELLSASTSRPLAKNLNNVNNTTFNVNSNPRTVMGGMMRAQTLPAPLPVSDFSNFQSLPLSHFLPVEHNTAAISNNNNTRLGRGGGGGGGRKRKGGGTSQKSSLAAWIPEVIPEMHAFHHSGLQQQQQQHHQQQQQQQLQPLEKNANDGPLTSFHPLQKPPSIELKQFDYGMDDDALLDRVASHTSAFAAFATTPLVDDGNEEQYAATIAGSTPLPSTKSRRIGLFSAASMPNRHWLSPAAAIHAARASKPGDEDVLAWLLHGK